MLKLIDPTRKMQELCEAGQSLKTQFSFAKINETAGTVERLHEWVMCRDFLGDVVYATYAKAKAEIYGFRAGPEFFTINDKATQMVVKFPTKVARDAFLANYEHIVHVVEKKNKLKLTKLTPTNDALVFAIEGHKFWQKTVWLISLYSYLLKCSCYPYKNVVEWRKEVVEKCVTESSYMMRAQKNWEVFEDKLKKILGLRKTPTGIDSTNINTIHNNCGFVAVLSNAHMNKTNVFSNALEKLTP